MRDGKPPRCAGRARNMPPSKSLSGPPPPLRCWHRDKELFRLSASGVGRGESEGHEIGIADWKRGMRSALLTGRGDCDMGRDLVHRD